MTMLPYDVYVHPDFSYKPGDWLATSSPPSSTRTMKTLIVVVAATLALTAGTAAGVLGLVDAEVVVRRLLARVGAGKA